MWVREGSGCIEELPTTGIPLGVLEQADFPQAGPITLESGDLVAIGTDGIWEAHDEAGEMFGKQRMRDLLTANAEGETTPSAESRVPMLSHVWLRRKAAP